MAVGIVIAMVLFGTVSAFVTATGNSTFHAAPYGIHSVIAGFIFGVGMVLTGGCASGSLYKAGEGNVTAMLVILSISVSQAIFADIGGWANNLVPYAWHQSAIAKGLPAAINVGDGWMDQFLAGYVWDQPVLLFSQWLGIRNSFAAAYVGDVFVGIVLPASTLLVAVYFIWYRKGYLRKQAEARRPTSGLRVELAGYWSMIMASKRTAIAGLVLGIAAGLHMYVMKGMQLKFGVTNFGTLMKEMGITFGLSAKGTVFDPGYWYVTTQEAQWVGWVFNKLGADNMDNIYFGLENGLPNPDQPGRLDVAGADRRRRGDGAVTQRIQVEGHDPRARHVGDHRRHAPWASARASGSAATSARSSCACRRAMCPGGCSASAWSAARTSA